MTTRKKLLFTVIVIIFSLASVECGLHLINWIKSSLSEKIIDYKLTLSPYKDKEWALELFTEIHDLQKIKNKKYAPFVGWRRSEYHGKWINIDADGVRRTWNPKPNGKEKNKSIYFFGV